MTTTNIEVGIDGGAFIKDFYICNLLPVDKIQDKKSQHPY